MPVIFPIWLVYQISHYIKEGETEELLSLVPFVAIAVIATLTLMGIVYFLHLNGGSF
jgi:hypothetical protein